MIECNIIMINVCNMLIKCIKYIFNLYLMFNLSNINDNNNVSILYI